MSDAVMSASRSELTVLLAHLVSYCESNDPLFEAQMASAEDLDELCERMEVIAPWIESFAALLKYKR